MDGAAASAGIVLVDQDGVWICTNANNTGWARATAHPGVEVEQLERPWETWLAKRVEQTGLADGWLRGCGPYGRQLPRS